MMYICAWPWLAVQPRGIDLLQDHRGGAQRQPGAAIFLGDQRGQIAAPAVSSSTNSVG